MFYTFYGETSSQGTMEKDLALAMFSKTKSISSIISSFFDLKLKLLLLFKYYTVVD